jgi:enterobacteria phage integrase
MPRKMPPFTERWRDRHGEVRVYGRRGRGPRVPLPADITSDEFREAYAAFLAGDAASARPKRERAAPGTIAALIESYMRSSAYVELRATTKKGYASRIEALRTKHGHRTVAGLTPERINVAILEPYAGKPGARLSILKMLRILIKHARAIGWLKYDPSETIKRPKTKEVRSWTEEEIAAFEQRWPVGTKQRLAFALHLYTGQRVSDVHRMTWADILPGQKIKVMQQKTGAKLTIRLHRELRAVLDQATRQHVTIINTEYGKPFSVKGYGQWLRDAYTDAGLPLDCKPHGLRKAAGRRLAEVGCSAKQIMAILGHKTLAEAERYTRDADQELLADTGVIMMEGHRGNRVAQTASGGVGKIGENEGTSE